MMHFLSIIYEPIVQSGSLRTDRVFRSLPALHRQPFLLQQLLLLLLRPILPGLTFLLIFFLTRG